MKSIYTLIPDIYELTKDREVWNENISIAGKLLGDHFSATLDTQSGNVPTRKTGLRLSKMAPRCPRQLWYETHHPELAEPLPPWAEIKYSIGHLLEVLTIQLAKTAGHEVTGEQDELVLDGIVGHRDCVIDGCVVDVKSAASRSFQKFKSGAILEDDSFGYLDQLDGYVVASQQDPLVRVKDKGYILAIDKQLGHCCLYEHTIRENSIRERIKDYRRICELASPPRCECKSVPHGSSGNYRLDVKASYNPYKWECKPNLRCFVYSDGPVYLTKVIRKPDVKEVDRYGKIIYN